MTANVPDTALTLEEVIEGRAIPRRDCRSCSKFEPNPQGFGFGWCIAHVQYVKLYHPQGEWHSQCQFKTLRQTRPVPAAAERS